MSENTVRAGYVSIVGRPNVGKSTLLNHLLGQKISITSRKPQTTRHNILGIKTAMDYQIAFVDTPGLHAGAEKALNRYMNRIAQSAVLDVDVVVFVVEKDVWTMEDQAVSEFLQSIKQKVVVAVNKVDQFQDKNSVLPHLSSIAKRLPDAEIVPISALRSTNLDELERVIASFLPASENFMFPEDQITDKSLRFLCAEIIREKIVRRLGAELPYETTVEIEQFSETEKLVTVSALILTEREGQKKILLGEKGERIKGIGMEARIDIERLVDKKVMLNLWVKVKSGWSDDDRALRSLGFNDE